MQRAHVHILDPKIRQRLGRYVWQSLLATLVILLIFESVECLMGGYLVSALGATTFIVFAMPQSRTATTRSLIGGYLAGTLWGVALSLLAGWVAPQGLPTNLLVLLGALAVGAAMCTMVAFDAEHPPAAGLALGYVMSPWAPRTPLYVLLAIALFALAHHLLRKVLVDLT